MRKIDNSLGTGYSCNLERAFPDLRRTIAKKSLAGMTQLGYRYHSGHLVDSAKDRRQSEPSLRLFPRPVSPERRHSLCDPLNNQLIQVQDKMSSRRYGSISACASRTARLASWA